MGKIVHRFEPAQPAQPAQPTPNIPVCEDKCEPVPVVQVHREETINPEPPVAPILQERLNLAESVQEVEENGADWNDQVDDAPYVGESVVTSLETVNEEDAAAGFVAIAMYDYQAGADDELSFDPDDVITNIEMVQRQTFYTSKIFSLLTATRAPKFMFFFFFFLY